jgi:hypothetical protein
MDRADAKVRLLAEFLVGVTEFQEFNNKKTLSVINYSLVVIA